MEKQSRQVCLGPQAVPRRVLAVAAAPRLVPAGKPAVLLPGNYHRAGEPCRIVCLEGIGRLERVGSKVVDLCNERDHVGGVVVINSKKGTAPCSQSCPAALHGTGTFCSVFSCLSKPAKSQTMPLHRQAQNVTHLNNVSPNVQTKPNPDDKGLEGVSHKVKGCVCVCS